MSDALKKLHTAMLDTRDGYAAAESEADEEVLRRLFQDMIEMRGRHRAELHEALLALGREPDDDKSLMATVHKAVVDIRSAVTGIDRSALNPFISGEEKLLELYDAAIGDADPSTAETLKRQKAEVVAQIEAMRSVEG